MEDIVLKSTKLIVKILLIGVLVFTVIAFTFVMYFFLYNGDYTKFTMTDFSKPKVKVLKHGKYLPYAITKIKVKGYVNDTIVIKQGYINNIGDTIINEKKYLNSIYSVNTYDNLLYGKIDTVLPSEDYGGGPLRVFVIYPYKAIKGKIDIEIHL